MIDIALLSANPRLVRMLSLELGSLGYRVMGTLCPLTAPLTIWDEDTLPDAVLTDDAVIILTKQMPNASGTDKEDSRFVRLARPFAMSELLLQVTHLLPPPQGNGFTLRQPPPHTPLLTASAGNTSSFFVDGEPLSLTEAENRLLSCLYQQYGQTVPRSRLCDLFPESDLRLMDVHICHIRQKLRQAGLGQLLVTVRGVGYRLGDPKSS